MFKNGERNYNIFERKSILMRKINSPFVKKVNN